jgi:anti-sigma-K factor RskA
MEEAELEDWFSSRRDALEEEFLTVLNAQGADAQEGEKRFDAQYRALIAQYQRRSQQIAAGAQRTERMQRPWRAIRARIDERIHAAKEWTARQKIALRKRLFDRKVRRLLRHRGPY